MTDTCAISPTEISPMDDLYDLWYSLQGAWRHYLLLRLFVYLAVVTVAVWFRRPLWRFIVNGKGAK